jgi:hypothetical protein
MVANKYEVKRLASYELPSLGFVPGNGGVDSGILEDMLQGDQRIWINIDN